MNQTAQAAGWFMSFISASVRPGITWFLFFMYAGVKAASITLAFQADANWADVLVKSWDEDDFGMLSMVLSFFFVGRSVEKYQKS